MSEEPVGKITSYKCGVCGETTYGKAAYCQHCGEPLTRLTPTALIQRVATTLDHIDSNLESIENMLAIKLEWRE